MSTFSDNQIETLKGICDSEDFLEDAQYLVESLAFMLEQHKNNQTPKRTQDREINKLKKRLRNLSPAARSHLEAEIFCAIMQTDKSAPLVDRVAAHKKAWTQSEKAFQALCDSTDYVKQRTPREFLISMTDTIFYAHGLKRTAYHEKTHDKKSDLCKFICVIREACNWNESIDLKNIASEIIKNTWYPAA